MTSALSEVIHASFKQLTKRLTGSTRRARLYFVLIGFIIFLVIPTIIFMSVEDWDLLDALYFSLVSLSTIGFGDFTPRETPPIEKGIEIILNLDHCALSVRCF